MSADDRDGLLVNISAHRLRVPSAPPKLVAFTLVVAWRHRSSDGGATNLGHEGPCADNVEGGHAKETLGVVHAFLLQHLVFVCVQVRECACVRRE